MEVWALLKYAGEEQATDHRDALHKRPEYNRAREGSIKTPSQPATQPLFPKKRGVSVKLSNDDFLTIQAIAKGEDAVLRPVRRTKRNFKAENSGVQFISDREAGRFLFSSKPDESFSDWKARQPAKVKVTPTGTHYVAQWQDKETGHTHEFSTQGIAGVFIQARAVIRETRRPDFKPTPDQQKISLSHYAAWRLKGEPNQIPIEQFQPDPSVTIAYLHSSQLKATWQPKPTIDKQTGQLKTQPPKHFVVPTDTQIFLERQTEIIVSPKEHRPGRDQFKIAPHHYAAWKVDGEQRGIDLIDYANAKQLRITKKHDPQTGEIVLSNAQTQRRFDHHAAFYVRDGRLDRLEHTVFSQPQITRAIQNLSKGGYLTGGMNLSDARITEKGYRLLNKIEPRTAAGLLERMEKDTQLNRYALQRMRLTPEERQVMSALSEDPTKPILQSPQDAFQALLDGDKPKTYHQQAKDREQKPQGMHKPRPPQPSAQGDLLLPNPVDRHPSSKEKVVFKNKTALTYLFLRQHASGPNPADAIENQPAQVQIDARATNQRFKGANPVNPESYADFTKKFKRTHSIKFKEEHGILSGTLDEYYKAPLKPHKSDPRTHWTYHRKLTGSVDLKKTYWLEEQTGRLKSSDSPDDARGKVLHHKAVVAHLLRPEQGRDELSRIMPQNVIWPRNDDGSINKSVSALQQNAHGDIHPGLEEVNDYLRFQFTSHRDRHGVTTFRNNVNDRAYVTPDFSRFYLSNSGMVLEHRRSQLNTDAFAGVIESLVSKDLIHMDPLDREAILNTRSLNKLSLTERGRDLMDRQGEKERDAIRIEKHKLELIARATGFVPATLIHDGHRESLHRHWKQEQLLTQKTEKTHSGKPLTIYTPAQKDKEFPTYQRKELGHETILAHGMYQVLNRLEREGAQDIRFIPERELRGMQTKAGQGVRDERFLRLNGDQGERNGMPDGVFLYRQNGEEQGIALEADSGGSELSNSRGYDASTLAAKDRWAAGRDLQMVYVVHDAKRATRISAPGRTILTMGR